MNTEICLNVECCAARTPKVCNSTLKAVKAEWWGGIPPILAPAAPYRSCVIPLCLTVVRWSCEPLEYTRFIDIHDIAFTKANNKAHSLSFDDWYIGQLP
jgi:hypothetical protein